MADEPVPTVVYGERGVAEIEDYIPAGCCCETKAWLGRKAHGLPQPHGSFYRMPPAAPPAGLTEYRPTSTGGSWVRVLLTVAVVLGLTVGVALAVINFTKV